MAIKLEEKRIKMLVKESVSEAMNAHIARLGALLAPYISAKEQKNIVKLYGRPLRKATRNYSVEL